jgi:lysophospholipase L1-like esterase
MSPPPRSPQVDERPTEDTTPRPEGAPQAKPQAGNRRLVRWLKGLPKKVALLALSVILTLGALEGVFRLFGYRPLYDEYSKPDAFWVRDRTLGWTLKPGTRDEFVGPVPFPVEFRTKIRVNSLGFRGGEIADLPPGGKRVVVLGDSQAAAFEVPERQTYEAVLQRRLSTALGTPIQVINAGVRGYGTDQELLYYRKRVRQLDPDIVVLHLSANDFDDNTTLHRTRRPFGKAAFAMRPDGSLDLVGNPVPSYPQCSAYRLDNAYRVRRVDSLRHRSFCWMESRLTDRSALFSFLITRIRTNPTLVDWLGGLGTPGDQELPGPTQEPPKRAPVTSTPSVTEASSPPTSSSAPPETAPAPPTTVPVTDYRVALTSRLLLQLASEVEQDGAEFVIVTQDADIAGLDTAAFERAGTNIVRVDQALGPDQNAVRFPNDGHFNARGHRAVAESLATPLSYLLAQ